MLRPKAGQFLEVHANPASMLDSSLLSSLTSTPNTRKDRCLFSTNFWTHSGNGQRFQMWNHQIFTLLVHIRFSSNSWCARNEPLATQWPKYAAETHNDTWSYETIRNYVRSREFKDPLKSCFVWERGLWECVFLLVLQCVVGANSSYTSSCLMSLPRCSSTWRCHQPKKSVKIASSRWRGNSIERLLHPSKPNILKQLHMQPCKHPCTSWGVHLPDIVLPWQKSSFQIDLSFISCNFPSGQGSTSFKTEYSYKI